MNLTLDIVISFQSIPLLDLAALIPRRMWLLRPRRTKLQCLAEFRRPSYPLNVRKSANLTFR